MSTHSVLNWTDVTEPELVVKVLKILRYTTFLIRMQLPMNQSPKRISPLCKCTFWDRFRAVWMVTFSREAELQELSFCKHDLWARRCSAAIESLTVMPPPPLTVSWPWLKFVVASNMLENMRVRAQCPEDLVFLLFFLIIISLPPCR